MTIMAKIKQKRRLDDKYDCYCGGVYSRAHKNRHFDTYTHKKYLVDADHL